MRIIEIRRRTRETGLSGTEAGWYAEVEQDGSTYHVSKLDGESQWTIDAEFRGSFPVHVNGYGARYLITRKLGPLYRDQLDAAAQEAS